jgi:hypothetical protein
MKKIICRIFIIYLYGLVQFHSESIAQTHNDHAHDHGSEEDIRSDSKEEGHHSEENAPNVGPKKGILAANDQQGIQLSPEAIRNFEIKTKKLSSAGPWTIPLSSRFQSAEEINLYRLRNGFFKRIDFIQIKRDSNLITVNSKDLKMGDEIVTNGIGFLRIAEVAAFGGAPQGHSH